LQVVYTLGRKVHVAKRLDDLVEQVLSAMSDLLIESEPVHNVPHVFGELVM
jgi:hypothetical protein